MSDVIFLDKYRTLSLDNKIPHKGGGNGSSGIETRLTRLEVKVDHIEKEMGEIKTDVREIRNDLKVINDKILTVTEKFSTLNKDISATIFKAIGVIMGSLTLLIAVAGFLLKIFLH